MSEIITGSYDMPNKSIIAVAFKKYFLNYYRTFEALAKYCLTNPPSPTNLIIMLSFFTTTAMQRRFSVQISMAGTAKLISVFIMGIKPNLPEVSLNYLK
jgi:hypothetical protein